MHILMISLDSTLATRPDGGALRRHIDYAARAGQLTIIVYTTPSVDAPQHPSPHLTIIPTNSISRYTFVWDALRLARQTIRHQKPDLITTQDIFATGLVGWLLRRSAGVPLLAQNHCYFIDNQAWLQEKPIKNHIFNWLGKFVSHRADIYRTVNNHERETYLAKGGNPERVFTHPLGTASSEFVEPPPAHAIQAVRDQFGYNVDHKIILWVGYPVPFKRVPLLLESFQRVVTQEPNARLLVIGDMSKSRDDLPALVHQLGLNDTVTLYGPVPHAELPAYYAASDVYAMTSAYEGIPRVLMEASAAGLPLVGFDRVGVAEVIEDGVNGYLVPEGDLDAHAARLIELLREPQTAQRMGAAARQHSAERFSATKNAETIAQMWEDAIQLGVSR